ncbi:hypothetical protein Taro_038883 [Colocasia esculenta]|uniref:Uncharacterized protein n=1 Tax=Colocasia esculenta TaxID=4460 RepID=A0A843WNI5_COLES|nr:hypothetical protein [Colocasia esculenta]
MNKLDRVIMIEQDLEGYNKIELAIYHFVQACKVGGQSQAADCMARLASRSMDANHSIGGTRCGRLLLQLCAFSDLKMVGGQSQAADSMARLASRSMDANHSVGSTRCGRLLLQLYAFPDLKTLALIRCGLV